MNTSRRTVLDVCTTVAENPVDEFYYLRNVFGDPSAHVGYFDVQLCHIFEEFFLVKPGQFFPVYIPVGRPLYYLVVYVRYTHRRYEVDTEVVYHYATNGVESDVRTARR